MQQARKRRDKGIEYRRIDLTLRTAQIDYLEYVADKNNTFVSPALEAILNTVITEKPTPAKPPRKHRRMFTVLPLHIVYIDKLAAQCGLTRSDIARRLIDEALAKDASL